MPDLATSEIVALSRIVDELDYYQLMHVRRGASAREVKAAYYASTRSFHPDVNRGRAPELLGAVGKIAKRLAEAYAVLRDPRRREAYDRMLEEGGGVRIQLAEAQADARRQAQANEGRTPQGRQFYARARSDLARGDKAGAELNLQTALTFEPDNEYFRQRLAELRPPRRRK